MTATTLVTDAGERIALDLERWRADPDHVEAALLAWLPDPVLDVGCGPGRLTAALAAAGRVALGIDPSAAAVAEACRRGAPVLRRSVFAVLPGEGRWGSAVLLDGNVGIGGDPVRLLARLRDLVRVDGVVLAEVEPDGGCRELTVRIDSGGRLGPPFPWATVGLDAWAHVACCAGLAPGPTWELGGRYFATAVRP